MSVVKTISIDAVPVSQGGTMKERILRIAASAVMLAGLGVAAFASPASASPTTAAAPPAYSLASSSETITQADPFTCREYGYGGVTNARTPVHVGPSGDSTVTGYIAAGRTVHLYYECINSAGNIWYEITGHIDDGPGWEPRFIWSNYV
jgi:hypothetical protein